MIGRGHDQSAPCDAASGQQQRGGRGERQRCDVAGGQPPRGVVVEHQRRHRVVAAAVDCRLAAGDGWRRDASFRITITWVTVEALAQMLIWCKLVMVASI